jgi:glutamate racemase
LIENGQENSAQSTALLGQYLWPMLERGMDILVLGCTHYSLLAQPIQKIVGEKVRLIDTSSAVAQRLFEQLSASRLLTHERDRPAPYLLSTKASAGYFAHMAEKLLSVRWNSMAKASLIAAHRQ